MRYPRIIAHRCGGALAPENTLAGLMLAARLGCCGVEFDTMLSRDGIPVLMHDETLDRTTDGHGALSGYDWTALSTLDAGARHHEAFADEPIPTLAQALALCAELGLWANIEIKPAEGRESETGAIVGRQLGATWRGPGVISSFSPVALEAARKAAPAQSYALLVEDLPSDWRERTAALGCTALHCSAGVAPAAIAAASATGLLVACYTVNDHDEAARLFAAGATAIFTDRPDRWLPDELSGA